MLNVSASLFAHHQSQLIYHNIPSPITFGVSRPYTWHSTQCTLPSHFCKLRSRITHSSNLGVYILTRHCLLTARLVWSQPKVVVILRFSCIVNPKSSILSYKKWYKSVPYKTRTVKDLCTSMVKRYYVLQCLNIVDKMSKYIRTFCMKRKPTCHHMKWYSQINHYLNYLLSLKNVNGDVPFLWTCIFILTLLFSSKQIKTGNPFFWNINFLTDKI